jgi:hypothetical protein
MAKNMLKEAIADAKAVREVALANAKAALEEAFTPKLQSMLSAKLSEELDDDGEIELEEIQGLGIDDIGSFGRQGIGGEEELDEVIDLEAILNELELEESADAEEEPVTEEMSDDDDDKEELDEMQVIFDAESANDTHYTADKVHEGCTNCDDNFDLDSLLEEINNVDIKENKVKIKEPANKPFYMQKLKEAQKELKSYKNQLNRTEEVLNSVRYELNEVNLLNSKLLYVNRVFKANNLSDGQKLRVVETFDKAASVKEAKLIYETIKDTFSIKNTKSTLKRKTIKEGLGMASKATGMSTAPKKVISETDNMVTRMQKLANIKINQ